MRITLTVVCVLSPPPLPPAQVDLVTKTAVISGTLAVLEAQVSC